MLSLPLKLYNSAEQLTGKKLLITLGVIFSVSLAIGLLIGYIMTPTLTEDELFAPDESGSSAASVQLDSYTGRVVRLPEAFHQDGVTYVLTDAAGNDIILLRASDQKLEIVENLFVQIQGTTTKLSDGTEVLAVKEVVINNR